MGGNSGIGSIFTAASVSIVFDINRTCPAFSLHMKQDTDLNAIRARPNYQSLVRDLSFPRVPFAH
jgi:hypothetical protein